MRPSGQSRNSAVVQEFGPDDRNIVYVREPDGSLAARAYPDEWTGEIYYFDALGSTVVMTDMQGNVTDTYAYDAWGEVDHLSGSTADNPYLYVGELGYYHHWQAPALADILHLGVRFYEPEVGRFSRVDPIEDGLNWYGYVEGRPTAAADPTGLKSRQRSECERACRAANPVRRVTCPGTETDERFLRWHWLIRGRMRDGYPGSGLIDTGDFLKAFDYNTFHDPGEPDYYSPRDDPCHPINNQCVVVETLALGPERISLDDWIGRVGYEATNSSVQGQRDTACMTFCHLRETRGRSPLWNQSDFLGWYFKYYSLW